VPHLKLSLLGPFRANLDGHTLLDFESNKVRALLAFLGVENEQPQQRIELATLLWPSMNDAVALRNLRHALSNLRRTLGDTEAQRPLLKISRHTVQLNPAAEITVDVIDFRRHLARATAPNTAEDARIAAWQTAVTLVQGEFLQGFRVRDSTPWEEWVLLRREACTQGLLQALRGLCRAYEHRGAYAQALAYARQWVQEAPWNEEAHRCLIRLLALDGQRAAALSQYDLCCHQLESKLGVEPAPETVALAAAIRNGTFSFSKSDGTSSRNRM
jgi:DNA-binding SARP family transcriptional activator